VQFVVVLGYTKHGI